MSSNPINELCEKVRSIQRRRARLINLREMCLAWILLASVYAALAVLEIKFQLPPSGRIALTAVVAAAAGLLVWRFFHVRRRIQSDDRRIAHYVDEQIPQLEQRLMTSLEFEGKNSTGGDGAALVERLWQDTLERLRDLDLAPVSSIRGAWPSAAAAIVVLCSLIWAVWSSSEFSLAGRRILMPWVPSAATAALPVELRVEPGNIKIQRGSDVLLVARIANAAPRQAEVYLQTGLENWDRVPMRPEGAENTFAYFLAAVQKDVTYYIDIGVKRSERYTISVVELPRVEQIAVDYVYPEHTGLKNRTVKDGGDVTAPEGTRITLQAAFNKPVDRATVHFGDGTSLDLAVNGAAASASFTIAKDDTYTIRLVDTGQLVNENPYEYFIRSIPDTPPEVTLIRPGRDRRVMSLEEVTIDAAAEDDYGLAEFALNYTVAGGDDRKIDLLALRQGRPHVSVSGRAMLYLEELKVAPGDLVSYYLTARDDNRLKGAAEIVSDIYFLEVVPTDATFSRAPQQAGGGGGSGGGGRSSSALVQNQKQIIAATWKLLKRRPEIDSEVFEKDVATITDSQRQVMQRARMSLRRLSERLSFSDDSYQRAVEYLQEAVGHMESAIENLATSRLKQALGPEQAALQAIMKAEAESRNTMIQIARNRGGGGGGQSDRERQDLTELFEMEMGRLENRYELPKQAAAARQNGENSDALEKLRELARRQERLNRAQKDLARRQDRMDDAQKKRRLEELRREQEKLRRDAEELSRRMSQLARRDGQRQWSDRRQQLAEAARRMQEAERNLRARNPGTALSKGQQAADQLRDQEREMGLDRQASVSHLVDELRHKGRSLQQQEQQISQKLQALKSEVDSETPLNETQAARLTDELLADKDRLKQELTEAESMLKSIGRRGRTDQPEVADRARQTLRDLRSEQVDKRIEQSREMLEAGWLTLAEDTEKKIGQSIDRVGDRLQNLDRPAAPSREEQIRQAAAAARGLRQELEKLQKEMAELQKGNNTGRQQPLSGMEPQDGQMQPVPGNEDGGAAARMQGHLQRSRRYARGLVQPWARGQRWGIDARSIQRELTQKEIEDFLAQPDLWQKLLKPVRELEATLQAQAKGDLLKKKVVAVPEETVPPAYRDLVDEYYRELSQAEARDSRQ